MTLVADDVSFRVHAEDAPAPPVEAKREVAEGHGPFRVAKGGTRIDRRRPVTFSFDGREYQGFEGDTLASALMANGVTLMGRSFKYHRPRGVLTAGFEEPNALVEVRDAARREPNARASMVEVFEGLTTRSQNRWPSLRADVLSVNQLLSPFLTAGFYYKTFMWPSALWEPLYEKVIRRSAGLGRAADAPDPDSYEHAHAHCEVLVVGAGPAGLSAALAAGRTGARVWLADEQPELGGTVSFTANVIDGRPAGEWARDTVAELESLPNVTIMRRTGVFGYYDDNVLAAVERVTDHLAEAPKGTPRQRMWTVRAKRVVLAGGSHERLLVFDDNDRPGIMLASAVRLYLERHGVAPGRRVVVCTNNDGAYATALALHEAGVAVPMVADARDTPGPMAERARAAGLRVELGVLPRRAKGRHKVTGIELQTVDGQPFDTLACDCIAVSGGHSPDVGLASQAGAKPVWRDDIMAFVPPADGPKGAASAGAANGAFALDVCLREGHEAGREAAALAGFEGDTGNAATALQEEVQDIVPVWRCPSAKKGGDGKAFVDLQNDVTAHDIALAHQEGFRSVEHVKRYTTLGMATDGGKTSSVNGLALLATARGQEIPDVGTTRFRPPHSPVAIAAFAGHERGREFQPTRRTAMHDAHEKLGAVFVEAGQWLRPQYYPRPGEGVMETIFRESRQVRETVGLCDVSTLGKIELFGADAAEFLNRLYINGWKMLAPGKARYGVMLREDGHVFDDGTTSRLADDHFLMTTTTANAARVLAHMEHYAQVVWPDLDVAFCSATEQWCGVAVAGPRARLLLADVLGDALDVSDEALPFMGVRTFEWRGTTARVFRISFSGELAFEVNVPWRHGAALWNALMKAGKPHGVVPYGTEALSVLRIEKGHVAGNELDGRTTAADMGLGRMMSTKKPFVGQVMAGRTGMVEGRATLVGLKLKGEGRLRGGAHLVADPDDATTETSLGWVTSVGDSPQLGCWIGLAYLKGGMEREGETLHAVNPLYGEAPAVEVCSPHFFDPDGERLRG